MKLTNPEDTLTGHGQGGGGGGGLGGGLMERDGTDGGPTDQTDCSEPESISKRFCCCFVCIFSDFRWPHFKLAGAIYVVVYNMDQT